MPFYATALCMLVVTSLLLFSAYCHANRQLCLACLRVMLGSVFFFLSDNLLAAAKFNNDFIIDREVCSVLIMVTYYSAQMLIAKGAVRIAALNRGHF